MIINEDCREGMNSIDDDSIGFVVTSPPYWSIVDYDVQNQIGFGQTIEEYLSSMKIVIEEMFRVLGPGCRAAINIGDQYLRASEHGRYRVEPIPSYLSIIGMNAGFDHMGGIIWNKISTTKTSGGCSLMGSMYYPKDGHVTYEHEFILLLKKPGKVIRPSKEILEKSKLSKEERLTWFRGMWSDVRPSKKVDHPAAFPVEIPLRLIKMYSFWGETILDPFMGSGTTAVASRMTGRDCVGFEINPDFCQIAERRVSDVREAEEGTV